MVVVVVKTCRVSLKVTVDDCVIMIMKEMKIMMILMVVVIITILMVVMVVVTITILMVVMVVEIIQKPSSFLQIKN